MAKGKYYGTTKEEEALKYAKVKAVAQKHVDEKKADVGLLQAELHELSEVYDADEKEGLAQWFLKDNRFREVRKELQRAERACKKPFFGRIDFIDPELDKKETYYIGKAVISEDPSKPIVIDWRSPVASVYYEQNLGECKFIVPDVGLQSIELERKRTYEVDDKGIVDFYDSEVVANDDLLTKYLSKSSRNVLGEIIATIQQEQNEVIRINPHHNIIVQGSAGSGKTTIAMHRISYILYNYDREFTPEDFYIIGSNKMLLNYITGVLPDLDVYDIGQMTMEELFVRLLYEEWDPSFYHVRKLDKKDSSIGIKGNSQRFLRLEKFCDDILKETIVEGNIRIEESNAIIMTKDQVKEELEKMQGRTKKDIDERLTDLLISHLETELFGRGFSYSSELQKKLYTRYNNYFSRKKIKDSSFDLYERFVRSERIKDPQAAKVFYDRYNPDLYDLAALAYIYKRLKETEVIREACHVVIDEAQDFGIFIYRSLKKCLSKCTFTIMGDVSQNINLGCGLSDWEELKEVMLPDPYDYFGLLRKSYRNTIEISNFATNVLQHGTFPIYPVEPIIRHGKEVEITRLDDFDATVSKVAGKADELSKEYETIAVICKDLNETDRVFEALSKEKFRAPLNRFDENNMTIERAVTVLPIEYSKGLEFDAVIIFDASDDNYPKEDGYAKLLYVAATRALHELTILYTGNLTRLITDPVSKERIESAWIKDEFRKRAIEFEPDIRSKSEKAKDQSFVGDYEMALRDKYGPRRNEASAPSAHLREIEKPSQRKAGRYDEVNLSTVSSALINKNAAQKSSLPKEENASKRSSYFDDVKIRKPVEQKPEKPMATYKPPEIKLKSVPKKTTDNAYYVNGVPAYLNSPPKPVKPVTVSGSIGSLGDEKDRLSAGSLKLSESQADQDKINNDEFGQSPMTSDLNPSGHGKIDTCVLWVNADKKKVMITSPYGNLSIIPVSSTCFRITFSKGNPDTSETLPPEILLEGAVKFRCNQGKTDIEITTEAMTVLVNRKTGALSFKSSKGGELLKEDDFVTRQIDEKIKACWNFFSFGKKEVIKACDYRGQWSDITGAARFVSNNGKCSTQIMSMKGYKIIIPKGQKILLNDIGSTDRFIRFDAASQIDYFFVCK